MPPPMGARLDDGDDTEAAMMTPRNGTGAGDRQPTTPAGAAPAPALPLPPPPPPPPLLPQNKKPAAGASSSVLLRCSSFFSSAAANARRPDTITVKTLPPKWRALQSRWRYLHALTFYVGWPAHVLWRVWPPLLLNMAVACLIAADHLVRAYAGRALLPDLNPDIVRSLDPLARYLMFSVSLLLALRLNRVYDRWFLARQSFSQIGSAALALCQRFESHAAAAGGEGGEDRDALIADVVRFCVVWHYSVLQVCLGEKEIRPAGAAWMHADELAAYRRARKGRQFAGLKLVQLVAAARFDPPVLLTAEAALQRGVSAQGACTTVRNQAMPYSLTLLSTGFVEVFLLMLPLSSLGAPQVADYGGSRSSNGITAAMAATTSASASSLTTGGEPPHQRAEAGFTAATLLLVYLFINLLFLGADEVGVQLENPYAWFPAEDIVRSTARDCVRMLREARELRGMTGGGGGGGGGIGGDFGGGLQATGRAGGRARGPPRPLEELVPPG